MTRFAAHLRRWRLAYALAFACVAVGIAVELLAWLVCRDMGKADLIGDMIAFVLGVPLGVYVANRQRWEDAP